MNDDETIAELQKWFRLTHVSIPFYWPWYETLDKYRTLKGSGHTHEQIVNLLVQGGLDRTMVGAFVAGMGQLEAGFPIQDPSEAPSFAETFSGYASKIPWAPILALGLAYAFVTQGLPRMLKK